MATDNYVCRKCGKRAGLLCDYEIGRGPTLPPAKPGRPERPGKLHTCDMPFCAACRGRLVASALACRRGRGGGCSHVTVDYCPVHAGAERREPLPVMGELEAAAERGRVWAALPEAATP